MLASSPIEKTAIQADISGKLLGNLRQTAEQGKRGSHPLTVSGGSIVTKVAPRQVTHKYGVDMGKGFQLMGEDVCKK